MYGQKSCIKHLQIGCTKLSESYSFVTQLPISALLWEDVTLNNYLLHK